MGISVTGLAYDASGTETVKSSSTKNEKNASGLAPIASIFFENEVSDGTVVGLDIIPYGAKVADASNSRTDTDTDDASDTAGTNSVDVNFKNHLTLYVEKSIDSSAGNFVKFGLSSVEIQTDESMATGSQYGDKRVMGVMLGYGKKTDLGDGAFLKVEGQVSRYQGATFDGNNDTDGVKNSIELDAFNTAGLKVSIGKSF